MLRTPVLPLETLQKVSLSQPADLPGVVTEALAIASPSLLNSIFQSENPRKQQKALASLRRYLSRMATRPTPFGLFAGVSWGSLGAVASGELENHYQKHVRPDQKWLLALVDSLETRWDIVKNTTVRCNPAILESSGRFVLPFVSGLGQQTEGKVTQDTSIRASAPVREALSLAHSPVYLQVLLEKLLGRFPEATESKIQGFLHQLLRQEFLISSLRPPLTVNSPLEYLMTQLQHIEAARSDLKALQVIQQELRNYETLPMGVGQAIQAKLVENMQAQIAVSPALQVDLELKEAVTIPSEVGQELARALEILWRISPSPKRLPHLESYHQEFLERYGSQREIPVLELLHPGLGLGVPESYLGAPGYRIANRSRQVNDYRQSLLCELAMTASREGLQEIVLTEEHLNILEGLSSNPMDAPDFAEVYAEILASSLRDIEQGEFLAVIGPNPGTSSLGATFGRFLPFSDELSDKFKFLVQGQSEAYPEVDFIKASYLPPMGHWGNVAIAPSLYPTELALGTNPGIENTLSLEDVLVGATPERFYLRSRKTGKELRFQSGQMLSLKHSPAIYRFLVEVSQDGIRGWGSFNWGPLSHSPFLPRIRYGRTILSPATWNFSRLPEETEAWNAAIQALRERWNIPNAVYLLQGDQRILLNLSQPEDLAELRHASRQSERITLCEMVGDVSQRWLKNPEGSFVTEIVLPLQKRSAYRRYTPIPAHTEWDIVSSDRVKPPGSEWFYLKLSLPAYQEEEFLLEHLYPFAEEMVSQGTAEQWFYLRYQAPTPHLRLRLKGNPDRLFQETQRWAEPLLQAKRLQQYSIETYEREIERYGGPDHIADAEAVFCENSRLCCQLLELMQRWDFPWARTSVAAICLVFILDLFGATWDEQMACVSRSEHGPHSLDALCQAGAASRQLGELPYGQEIYDLLRCETTLLKRYGQGLSGNSRMTILKSLLHMHCNRLLGRERQHEREALSLARKIIERKVRILK